LDEPAHEIAKFNAFATMLLKS